MIAKMILKMSEQVKAIVKKLVVGCYVFLRVETRCEWSEERVPRQDQEGEAFKRGCRKAMVGPRSCDLWRGYVISWRAEADDMELMRCGWKVEVSAIFCEERLFGSRCFSVSLSLLHPTYDVLLFSSETLVSISSGETRRIADMAGAHHNETEPLQLQTTAKRAKAWSNKKECHLNFIRECMS